MTKVSSFHLHNGLRVNSSSNSGIKDTRKAMIRPNLGSQPEIDTQPSKSIYSTSSTNLGSELQVQCPLSEMFSTRSLEVFEVSAGVFIFSFTVMNCIDYWMIIQP